MWEIPGVVLALLWNAGWSFFVLAFLGVVVTGGLIYLKRYLFFIGKDEQLFVEGLTDTEVTNGPDIVLLPPTIKSAKKVKAITLGSLDYVVIKNSLSGESRVVQGPTLLFLKPYDSAGKVEKVISLKVTEFVRFLDQTTGTVRVEVGEQGRVVPNANEVFLDAGGKRKAIDLKCFEYVKLEDKKTGHIRVEKGEKLVYLNAFEEVVGSKREAIAVDEETAVLIVNKRTGQQSLKTQKQAFIPGNDEEVLEIRQLIKLAEYEACIVRDEKGHDEYYFGKNKDQRSFFLPPYCNLVPLTWSRGRRRERRDLVITQLDLRPHYMSFEFNCRTSDNVELVLEGSFFWEINDLKAMMAFTSDTSGDVCNHARSKFIERVSKVTLQQFMADFNTIAAQVHEDDNSFYKQRGVLIHSLEVTGYRCAETATAKVLGAIIQETTNRMNRLQQQESENEVQLFQIKGDIDEERAKGELLAIQTENAKARAEMEGLGEAQKVSSFLDGLRESIPDAKTRVEIWNVLRKRDALHEVSSGKSTLFFTPQDVNLRIENHA